jgi:transcriptional regulator with XRE-family HTH domain
MEPVVYNNIKRIRELKDLTREYVAYELNMSSSGYGKIERGEVDLTLAKLQKIATILEVNIEFILKFNAVEILKGR